MKLFVAIAAGALAATVAGASPPAQDPDVSAFACQLGGDCGTPDQPGVPAALPTGPAPRATAVRGFTFRRDAATPAASASGAAPGVAMSGSAHVAAAIATHGAADLRLNFTSGSASLDDGDRARLAKLATALALPALNGRRVRIEGHTDARGSASANLDLSRRRAQAVADYLVSSGVGPDRLQVVGYGATRPLPGHDASDGANRRVMAVMLD